ncbi:DUF2867 domain-containing protein [Nocardioides sp.]|uniref:DUF2867 domain-containing protein n=1 Tax=Nocardioides sp. TaxID=35761 RepID=UPI001A28485D|nr:DUF2867 domain-containing protein [Nocardioides sp.]MBJ7357420.1 DUF2867 domain-containing protein [Nocardioides sp.]
MERRTRLHASTRSSVVELPLAQAHAVVASGEAGPQWYVDALPFVVRGGVDRLLGGAGRHAEPPGRPLLAEGDVAGLWRVVRSTARELLLRAEVRAPGVVELSTRLRPEGEGRTRIEQTISLDPDGLAGQLYLLADLPARETVVELAHRRLLRDLR